MKKSKKRSEKRGALRDILFILIGAAIAFGIFSGLQHHKTDTNIQSVTDDSATLDTGRVCIASASTARLVEVPPIPTIVTNSGSSQHKYNTSDDSDSDEGYDLSELEDILVDSSLTGNETRYENFILYVSPEGYTSEFKMYSMKGDTTDVGFHVKGN